MRKIWVVWLIGLFSIVPSVSARESSMIAVFPTWEPYGYVENGKAAGFEIETFQAVMDQMKMRVVFLHQPWKRCLYSVKNGLADVVISALKIQEREVYLYYPDEPISISRTALFARKDGHIVFNGSFESLKGYTIGVTNGFSYGPEFDAASFLQKDASTETHSVVVKVLLGRNALGAGNIAVIKTIAKKQNALEDIRFLTPLLHTQKLYVGFSKVSTDESQVTQFSAVLARFRQSKEFKLILKKYSMD
jgi:polar amino acid transport system substrate-binding protein